MPSLYSFLKPLADIFFILAVLSLILLRVALTYAIPTEVYTSSLIDLFFHGFISIILWLFFIKKYNADKIRTLLIGFFLLEFTIGNFLKKTTAFYGAEITTIGLIGILVIWLNTHSNRSKFN